MFSTLALLVVLSGEVRSIELPRFQPELPSGAGRDAFAVACLSCHSARYVTMQPKFSEAKWEEIVRKMIKTYAAPISEEQVPQIAKFMVATQNDPAWSALAGVAADDPSIPTIELAVPESEAFADDLKRGKALYARDCASCHGQDGAGDGTSAAAILPRPTDLRARHYSLAAIAKALWNGVPGTAMPSYRSHSKEDRAALATFIRNIGRNASRGKLSSEELEEATKLFVENCAACHGVTGAGDGLAAGALPRRATDFHNVQPSRDSAVELIANGIAGSSMPQWSPRLTRAQQDTLSTYIRSFADDAKSGY